MATTDATPIPIKNQAIRVYFPILDADGDLVSGATGLDTEDSGDGATFADTTGEATEVATSSGMYYVELTAAEMNYDAVCIIVKSNEGKTTPIVLYPQEAGDIPVDVQTVSGDATAADNLELFFDGTGYNASNSTVGTATNLTTNNDKTGYALSAAGVDAIWDEDIEAAHGTDATAGFLLRVLGAAISNRANNANLNDLLGVADSAGTDLPEQVWSETVRILTASTNFNDISTADVNAQVLDVMNTDTFAEPGSVPAATATLVDMIHWLYTLSRNEIQQTATQQTLRNDADSGNIATAAVSDNGTTAQRDEWV